MLHSPPGHRPPPRNAADAVLDEATELSVAGTFDRAAYVRLRARIEELGGTDLQIYRLERKALSTGLIGREAMTLKRPPDSGRSVLWDPVTKKIVPR